MKGLGKRIQFLRKQRKITLIEMAAKTGIDQATLSRMENEKMTGTLNSHMRIAQVLGLRLPDLYDQVIQPIEESQDRAARKKIETFSHSSGAVAELLTGGVLQKKMMPVLLKIRPKGRTEPEEYQPLAERFVYVLAGDVQVKIKEASHSIKTGETLYFNASFPHHFENQGKTEARLISVLTPTSL